MKILQIHNFYKHSGGEDSVVAAEAQLLRKFGHSVEQYTANNKCLVSGLDKLLAFIRMFYSARVRQGVLQRLNTFQPDLVHVHNFFPLLTPSVYDACIEKNIPVIQTLHNYRILCSNGLFLRDGQVCEKCLKGAHYSAVQYGCYRNSRLTTLAVAMMLTIHQHLRTWANKIDQFIALSEFAKYKFAEGGLPADKIVVKPNFTLDHNDKARVPQRRGIHALFVGRLVEEKGVHTLLEAWRELDLPLRIVGDGPLSADVNASSNPAISWLGAKSPSEVAAEMDQAACLVVPSVCYEGFPMVMVEAFSHKLPVIASRLGSLAGLVEDGTTGLLFSPGDAADLASRVRWAQGHHDELLRMGERAKEVYLKHFTPEINYQQMMSIYKAVLDEKSPSR